MFRVVALTAAVLCGLFVQSGKAAELRFSYPELATFLRAILKDAEIHLNNKPNSGLLALIGPKQSYLKVGTTEIPIAVPPHSVFGTNYYVHQVDSTKIGVTAVKQAVRVSVDFKAEGPAIVASSTAVPWVQWRDAAIDIDFKPIKTAKGLSFEVTRVEMRGPFLASCPPNDGFASVTCDLLALGATKQQMAKVRSKVEVSLKEHLNGTELRDQFADTIASYLSFAKSDDVDIRIRDVRPSPDGVAVVFCIGRC